MKSPQDLTPAERTQFVLSLAFEGDFSGADAVLASWPEDEDKNVAQHNFEQIKLAAEKNIPAELIGYLYRMIIPEDGEGLIAIDLSKVPWDSYEEQSIHGILALGDPEKHIDDIWRILKPGGHTFLISDEEEPTGHTGACVLEDQGFEIRDAICVAVEAGATHYVAKASSSERNAGLPEQCPHPTVKPRDLMVDLVEGEEGPILDPFLGSGTTGVACLRTGHDFIGIEQNPEYLEVATRRVQHWDRAETAWIGANISSEAEIKEEQKSFESLEDLFGF
jgi:hypothetical protein